MYKSNFSIRRIPEVVAQSGATLLHFFSDDAYNMSGFNISYRFDSCPTTDSCKCSILNPISAALIISCLLSSLNLFGSRSLCRWRLVHLRCCIYGFCVSHPKMSEQLLLPKRPLQSRAPSMHLWKRFCRLRLQASVDSWLLGDDWYVKRFYTAWNSVTWIRDLRRHDVHHRRRKLSPWRASLRIWF